MTAGQERTRTNGDESPEQALILLGQRKFVGKQEVCVDKFFLLHATSRVKRVPNQYSAEKFSGRNLNGAQTKKALRLSTRAKFLRGGM